MALESILTWNMSDEEAKVYKLCMLWDKILDIELPGYFSNRLPKKSDPRKSLIFKYCYKLAKETHGLIPLDQYKLYILAQIQILKGQSNGQVHALIEPACLCGPKAWVRWEIWQKKYATQLKKLHNESADVKANTSDVEIDLTRTKAFFNSVLGQGYSKRDIETNIASKEIVKWIASKKISPYYLVMSPLIKKYFKEIEDTFTIDVELLSKSITPKVIEIFENLFPVEFNKSPETSQYI